MAAMRECSTDTESLRPGARIRVGAVTLLPIERLVLHADGCSTCAWFSAAKEPYALIVRDHLGIRAVDGNATAVSIEVLCEDVPGLRAALATL